MFYFTHLHTQMNPFLHKNSPQCHYFYWRLQTIYCAIIKRGFVLRYCKFEHNLPMRRLLYNTPWEATREKKGQHPARRQAKASHIFRASFIPTEKPFHFNLKSRVLIDAVSPRISTPFIRHSWGKRKGLNHPAKTNIQLLGSLVPPLFLL